ncbi:sperm protamine P1 family protein [Actinobaculum sp. oral taxon 183 str. F0552]|nr:sperm protamine P1 family protein [Actinobaculum sp. oral taxon 183 str. F0552]
MHATILASFRRMRPFIRSRISRAREGRAKRGGPATHRRKGLSHRARRTG